MHSDRLPPLTIQGDPRQRESSDDETTANGPREKWVKGGGRGCLLHLPFGVLCLLPSSLRPSKESPRIDQFLGAGCWMPLWSAALHFLHHPR